MRPRRIELLSRPWQGRVLPLNHDREREYSSIFCLDLQNALNGSIVFPLRFCTRGEMDITTVFGTVVLGSSPSGCTRSLEKDTQLRVSFSLH